MGPPVPWFSDRVLFREPFIHGGLRRDLDGTTQEVLLDIPAPKAESVRLTGSDIPGNHRLGQGDDQGGRRYLGSQAGSDRSWGL
jgi:hypothetical protein